MGVIASEITSLTIVYWTVYSDSDQRKHQSSMSLAFVWGPVNSPHKWPVTRKMFPFDDVIMNCSDTIRIWIRVWTLRRHSIAHPNRWAMGCFLLGFWRKLTLLKWCYTVFCYGVLNFECICMDQLASFIVLSAPKIAVSQDRLKTFDNNTFNTLRPRQNGCHFADDTSECTLLNENVWIFIEIYLKFIPKGPVNDIPALIQIIACCRPDGKPLSELMMVRILTHICITQPQWLKTDLLHKSHNVPVSYPIMHHFVTEMCTSVHISVTKWCIVGYLSNALWNLWYGSNPIFHGLILP